MSDDIKLLCKSCGKANNIHLTSCDEYEVITMLGKAMVPDEPHIMNNDDLDDLISELIVEVCVLQAEYNDGATPYTSDLAEPFERVLRQWFEIEGD